MVPRTAGQTLEWNTLVPHDRLTVSVSNVTPPYPRDQRADARSRQHSNAVLKSTRDETTSRFPTENGRSCGQRVRPQYLIRVFWVAATLVAVVLVWVYLASSPSVP
jgi:hypothetical protein